MHTCRVIQDAHLTVDALGQGRDLLSGKSVTDPDGDA
jgi:hypothetical protein